VISNPVLPSGRKLVVAMYMGLCGVMSVCSDARSFMYLVLLKGQIPFSMRIRVMFSGCVEKLGIARIFPFMVCEGMPLFPMRMRLFML